ncbi:hypothetical protein F5Y19DRAFT_286889 [Xylariaceae sp. FL1651]|nr:hypothetical protein F5Y19DRAFT_286889 [Xylariaceae sp. FL1651]
MPSRKFSGKMSTSAGKRSRTRESRNSKDVKPTPAQERQQEREETIRRIQERHARYCELPTLLPDRGSIIARTQFTRKRSAYPAYDDDANKRMKVGHGSKAKKVARRTRWERDSQLKQPPSLIDLPAGSIAPGQNPITAMGALAGLSTEIRDEILRYILLWPRDIILFYRWSRVFPRSRPRLHLSILSTCQVLWHQGLRILFGENTFAYNMRDPEPSHDHTIQVLEKVFARSVVPINKYGHLIRHVKVKIHRSRLHSLEHCQNFEHAILKFLPGNGLACPANLHTLTLEVPAMCKRDLKFTSWKEGPDDVPICRYLEGGSRVGKALLALQIQWVRVVAWDKYDQCWENVIDLRYLAKDRQMRLEHLGDNDVEKPDIINGRNNESFQGNLEQDTRYRPRDVEAMQNLWAKCVEKAKAKLRLLAWRIEGLAIAPNHAVGELGLWDPINVSDDCGSDADSAFDLVSLPSNWREDVISVRSRSVRSRAANTWSASDSNPSFNVATKNRAKAKAKAQSKTSTKNSTTANKKSLTILNKRDKGKEAKLLQAQQGRQENEAQSDEGNTLTENWLENVPNSDFNNIEGLAYNGELNAKLEQHEDDGKKGEAEGDRKQDEEEEEESLFVD